MPSLLLSIHQYGKFVLFLYLSLNISQRNSFLKRVGKKYFQFLWWLNKTCVYFWCSLDLATYGKEWGPVNFYQEKTYDNTLAVGTTLITAIDRFLLDFNIKVAQGKQVYYLITWK